MGLRKIWLCALAAIASSLLALECAELQREVKYVQFNEQARELISKWLAKNTIPAEWFAPQYIDLSDACGQLVPRIYMNLPREQWHTWLAERRVARVRKYVVRGAVAGGIAGSISRYCSPERSAWWPCACTMFGAAVGLLCSDISIAWNPLVPNGIDYAYDRQGYVWLQFNGLEQELRAAHAKTIYQVVKGEQVSDSFELRSEMDMGRIDQ